MGRTRSAWSKGRCPGPPAWPALLLPPFLPQNPRSMGMPACPNPTVLTQSRIHAFSYVVGAFYQVSQSGSRAIAGRRPILDRHSGTSPHLFRSRPGHNNKIPHLAHSIGRVEMYVQIKYPPKRPRQTKVSESGGVSDTSYFERSAFAARHRGFSFSSSLGIHTHQPAHHSHTPTAQARRPPSH